MELKFGLLLLYGTFQFFKMIILTIEITLILVGIYENYALKFKPDQIFHGITSQ